MMSLRSSLRACILSATALMGVPCAAQADTGKFQADERTITIEAPARYCNVDLAQTFDKNWFMFQSRAQGDMNRLIGAFLPCEDLAGLRDGTVANLSRWVLVLATNADANTLLTLPAMSDQEFVSSLSAEFAQGVELDTEETSRNVEQAAQDMGLSDGSQPLRVEGDGRPHLLGSSDKAVYISLKLDVTEGGQKRTVATVGGMALMYSHMIAVMAYSEYKNQATFDQLLIDVAGMTELAAQKNR